MNYNLSIANLTKIKYKDKSIGKKSIFISDNTSDVKFITAFEKFAQERKLSQKSIVEQLIIKFLQDNNAI
jgi:hypothetical protein